MKRLAIALALAGGVSVFTPARATAPSVMLHYPATTPGARFEVTPSTVLSWEADDWNMVRFPEDLSRWQAISGLSAVVVGPELAPNGLPVANKLIEAAPVSTHRANSLNFTATAEPYTLSVYVKPGTRSWFWLSTNSGGNVAWFNAATGTWGTVHGGHTSWTAEDAGNGWWRVSLTRVLTAAAYSVYVGITTGDNQLSYAGTSGTGLVWGVQMVRGAVAKPYRSPPPANLLASPSAFDDAAWNKLASGGKSVTVAPNTVRAPDGTMTADAVTFPAVTGEGQYAVLRQTAAASGASATFGIWAKLPSGTGTLWLDSLAASNSPIYYAQKACPLTTEWTRCTFTGSPLSTPSLDIGAIYLAASGITTTQPAQVVHLWGASVTRADQNGDTFVMTGTVPWSPTSALFPAGTGAGRRGVGPFSDTNYFGYATTSDPLDSTGDRYGCVAYTPTAAMTGTLLFHNGVQGIAGYGVDIQNSTGAFTFRSSTPTLASVVATTPSIQGALNVGCFWRTGTSIFAKLNLSATVTNASAGTEVAGTAYGFKIGRYETAGFPYLGTIHEMVQGLGACPDTSCETWATKQMTQAFANGDPARPLFSDAPTDKMHLVGQAYNGTSWSGPAWQTTTVGTVGYSDAFVPAAVPGVGNRGAYTGPSWATNYLTLGTATSDLLDFTGDFSACFNYGSNVAMTDGGVFSNSDNLTQGWYYGSRIGRGALGVAWGMCGSTGCTYLQGPALSEVLGGHNLACIGRTGNTMALMSNLTTYTTLPLTVTPAPGTSIYPRFGSISGSIIFPGWISGAWFSNEPPSDAAFKKIQNRAFGHTATDGTPITLTRTTTETYEVPAASGQTLWTAPAGVAAIGPNGIGIFRQSTNLAYYSADQSGARLGNATITANAIAGPDALTTAERVEEDSTAGVTHYVDTAVTTVVGLPYTYTAYLKAGTRSWVKVYKAGGAPTGCFVNLTTGAVGTCSTGSSAATLDVGGGWWRVRLSIDASYITGVTVYFGFNIATADNVDTYNGLGAGYYVYTTGWQAEQASTPTPHIVTTTAQVQRNADSVTLPLPLLAQDTNWCVSGVWTPYMRPWANPEGTTRTLWAAGTFNAANSARVEVVGPNLVYTHVDALGAQATVSYPAASISAGSRNVKACVAEGRQALYLDGQLVAAGNVPGAGDWQTLKPGAWSSVPATITLGARVAQTNHWDGYLRDFKVEEPRLSREDLAALDAKILVGLPYTSSGPLLERDASTVFHWVADEWNLMRLPEAWDQSPWSVANLATITANAAVAPDGTLTAEKLANGGGLNGGSQQSVILPTNSQIAMSFWVRADTDDSVDSGFYCNADGWRTPVTAGVMAGPGSASITGSLARFTGLSATAWTRVYLTASSGATTTTCRFVVYPDNSLSSTVGAAVMVWGAQVVRGDTALPYKSPPVANLLASPSNLSVGTLWNGTLGNTTATAQAAGSAPDGTTPYRVARGVAPVGVAPAGVYQTHTFAAASYTITAYARYVNVPCVGIALDNLDAGKMTKVNLQTGALTYSGSGVTAAVTPAAGGWWKISATATMAAGTNYPEVWLVPTAADCSTTLRNNLAGGTTGDAADFATVNLTRSDQNGDTLVMQGTVPLATQSPLFKDGFGTGRRGVGTFTDANYFTPTSANGVNFSGDFTACFSVVPKDPLRGTNNVLFDSCTVSGGGWSVAITNTTGGIAAYGCKVAAPGFVAITGAGSAVKDARNVICTGRSGTTQYLKANGAATASGVVVPTVSPVTSYFLGRAINTTTHFDGTIEEAYFTSTAWSEATVTQLQAAAMAQGDPKKPLFTPDANTVLHLKGNDYTAGSVWAGEYGSVTKVGTVSYSDAFVPPIPGRLQRQGYGPHSTVNYLSLGTGSDSLDFTGDFYVCAVFRQGAVAFTEHIFSNGTANLAGYYGQSGGVYFNFALAGTGVTYTASAVGLADSTSAINVVCGGRAGSTVVSKANLGTYVTAAAASPLPATATTARVGLLGSGVQPALGTVYEVIYAQATPSDALFTRIIQRARNQLAASGAVVTTTRTTPETFTVPAPSGSALWTAPAGSPAVTPWGIASWKLATNSVLQSETLCVANTNNPPWNLVGTTTCTSDTSVAPDGTTTADDFTTTTTAGFFGQSAAASGTVFTASVHFKKAATGYTNLLVDCAAGTATSCACGTSDGSPCTPSFAAARCTAEYSAIGTSWVRAWATVNCSVNQTAVVIYPIPGRYNVATGSASIWGAQLDNAYMTPYKRTTTGNVQGNADVHSTPLPTLGYANLITYSEQIDRWSASNGGTGTLAVVTPDVERNPFGAMTADRVVLNKGVGTTVTDSSAVEAAGSTAVVGQVYTACAWMRTLDGTTKQVAILTVGSVQSKTVTPEWTQHCYSPTAVTTAGIVRLALRGTWSTSDTATLAVWGAQLTQSSSALPYLATTSAIAYSTQKWCVDGYYTPGWDWNTTGAYQRDPFGFGLAGTANSARIYFQATGVFYTQFWDGSAVTRSTGSENIAHGLTGRKTARWTLCNNNGTLTTWVKGVLKATTTNALWTATPAAVHVGSILTYGEHFDGYIANFRVVNNVTSPVEIDALK